MIFIFKYYKCPNGLIQPRTVSTQDPTFGKFNGAQFLKFLPLDWVDNNTLIFFGEAVRTLALSKLKQVKQKQKRDLQFCFWTEVYFLCGFVIIYYLEKQ